jgi:methylated-DNA-[protein]-cysteine S-methyltransferase
MTETGTATDTATETAVAEAARRFAPPVRPPVLAGADVSYVVEDLAVGRLLLAARRDGTLLTSAYAPTDADADALLDRLAARVSPGVLRGGPALDDARRQLDEYLAGRRRTFELATDTVLATPFQRTVLDRLARDVGYGARTSYGALAAALGRPSASRAVGAALGANPLCIVLPCHRVVAASGALTGYAGGLAAKQRLLELEAAAA